MENGAPAVDDSRESTTVPCNMSSSEGLYIDIQDMQVYYWVCHETQSETHLTRNTMAAGYSAYQLHNKLVVASRALRGGSMLDCTWYE